MYNFNNRKQSKRIAAIICAVLVFAIVITTVLSAVL